MTAPTGGRGERRRQELVRAGVELLAEQGWGAITTRAVAQRAGANPGLVHYHFADLADLRRAITAAAVDAVVDDLTPTLVDVHDLAGLVELVGALLTPGGLADQAWTGPGELPGERLTVEVFAAAMADPHSRAAVADALVATRTTLAEWFTDRSPELHADRARGYATLATALVDGLYLHRIIDPALPVDDAVAALGHLADAATQRGVAP